MEYFLAVIFGDDPDRSELLGLFSTPYKALEAIKDHYNGEDVRAQDYMEKYGTINIHIDSIDTPICAQIVKMCVDDHTSINV